MIQLFDPGLPAEVTQFLATEQHALDSLADYKDRVTKGHARYRKLRETNFTPIVSTLTDMCSGIRRCCYCEDSAAYQVEHIWPQRYYPNLTFAWENYLFACGRCNSPKNDKFDIYRDSDDQRISAKSSAQNSGEAPEPGTPVLIDPRREDPMKYMILDLKETFRFVPVESPNTRSWERATYTIKLLNLNEDDLLPPVRENHFDSYRRGLKEYVEQKLAGAAPDELKRICGSIRRMGHITVLREMQRQYKHFPVLADLFNAAPEALTW